MEDGVLRLITCEHGGNRVPPPWAHLFAGAGAVLRTHRGYDPGSLRMARELAAMLDAPLVASSVSRLLIDLNRSPGRSDLYSEFTAPLDAGLKEDIFSRCYLPYRTEVETRVAQAHARGDRVLHVSSHSFVPELDGVAREADIGLLFDPARKEEEALCQRWQQALQERAPGLRIRMNYPYLGIADGLTTSLRTRFAARYAGIELEVNQKHVRDARGWRALRRVIAQALLAALDA